MKIIKYILWGVVLCGILLVWYLISPWEVFPIQSYQTSIDEMSSYAHATRGQHIALQQEYMTSDGVIRYLDLWPQDAPVVVLVHGTPTSSWMYRKVIARLVGDGTYRIIAPDMLGYGSSDKPIGKELYTTSKQADRLVWLMDSLNIDTWTQVTHDMGGTRTWHILKAYPNRITNLLILNAVWFADGFNPPWLIKTVPWVWYAFTKLITVDPFSRLIMSQTISMMFADPSVVDKNIVDGYLYPTMQWQRRVYGYFLNSLQETMKEITDTQSYLKENPTLIPKSKILRWANDQILSVKQIDHFKHYRWITDSQITILPEWNHLVAEEYPDMITKLLNSLLP